MRRAYKLTLLGVTIIVFLLVSAVLARVFSADGAERSAVTSLIDAEARGDAAGMIARLKGCSREPGCQARVRADAAALRRSGAVSILQLQPSTGFSLGSTVGNARVAWKTPASLPIVQCVRVRRAGNALRGITIELEAITAKLAGDAVCL